MASASSTALAAGSAKQSLMEAVSCPEYRERLKEVYITEAQIKAKVAELAAAISIRHRSSFKQGEVVAVGVCRHRRTLPLVARLTQS